MITGKIVLLEEDEVGVSYIEREVWEALYVVVRKKDGSCEIIKDRFDMGTNKSQATIALPDGTII